MISYTIFTDVIDQDDTGEDQVSVYKTRVTVPTEYTEEQVIIAAETQSNWSVVGFGLGDPSLVGKYFVECDEV